MNNEQSKIDALAQRLDEILPPEQRRVTPETKDPLLRSAVDFAQAPFPELSPEMMARVEARMLKAYAAPKPIIRFAIPRRAAAVASFVAVMMVSSLIPVAAESLPGELFYPVKQGIEQVELLFASSPQIQADVYLNHAERRLNEANTLLGGGTYNADAFAAVLSNAEKALALDGTKRVMMHVETLTEKVEASLLLAHELAVPPVTGPLETMLETLRATVVPATATTTPTMTMTPTATLTATATSTATATKTPTSTKKATPTATKTPTSTKTATPTATKTPTSTKTATPRPTVRPPTRVPTNPPDPVINPESQGTPNLGEGNPENQGNPPADPGNQGNPPADPGNQGNSNPPANSGGGNSGGGNKGK